MRRRLLAVPAFVGAFAFGLPGCGALLGLQDRTLVDDDAASDDAATSSTQHPSVSAVTVDVRATSVTPNDATDEGERVTTSDARTSAPEAAVPDAAVSDAATCADPCDLADGLNEPFVMTSDAYNVYWVDFGDTVGAGNGVLKSCAVGGCGGTPTVWRTGLMDPRGIAVDASNVYWGTTWGGVPGAMGAIWSCAVSPGASDCTAPTPLVAALDPNGIAIDASYVYWVDSNLNSVHRVRTNGTGGDDVLYAPPDGGLGVFLDSPSECAVDASTLYVADGSGNAYSLSKSLGGTPVLLQKSAGPVTSAVAVDGVGSAYFGQSGRILKWMSARTGSALPIVVNGSSIALTDAVSLAVDVTVQMLYWADFGSGLANDGAIGRSSLTGGGATLLQSKLETPSSVTISGNNVYWLSAGTLLSSTSTTTSYVQTNSGKLWRTHK